MHIHGGGWTDNKLLVMQRYFSAYAKALKNKPFPDRPFKRWYIDAFAGTGDRIDTRRANAENLFRLFGEDDPDVNAVKDGSVRIALGIDPPFDRYVLVDKAAHHVTALEALKTEFPDRCIDVRSGDANDVLCNLSKNVNWAATRAAVFIDPYGMQVEWRTLEALAKTKMDIALLFPTGPLNRVLTRDGNIPEEWARRIDLQLGECEWRNAVYEPPEGPDLLSWTSSNRRKVLSTDGLRQFVLQRMKSIFAYVCPDQLEMTNSRGAVLYHLFIICSNNSEPAKQLANKLASSAVQIPRKRQRK